MINISLDYTVGINPNSSHPDIMKLVHSGSATRHTRLGVEKGGSSLERRAPRQCAVGQRGTAAGQRPGVMVNGSWCGKVVHGGTVLVAATGSTEGDRGWH
jgi:hypothetical protein